MSVQDPSEVDAALTAKLLNDATLMALVPDGVFFDVAPQGATRFLILSAETHDDEGMQTDTTAYETFIYVIKAVTSNTSGLDVKTAAARLKTLLHYGTLTITGYSLMRMKMIERIRYTELDEDKDLRWQHRGGRFELMVSPS